MKQSLMPNTLTPINIFLNDGSNIDRKRAAVAALVMPLLSANAQSFCQMTEVIDMKKENNNLTITYLGKDEADASSLTILAEDEISKKLLEHNLCL